MPKLTQSPVTLSLHFITLKVARGINNADLDYGIFDQRDFSDQFVKTLIFHIDQQKLELYGFVILSNQIHLIVNSNADVSDKLEALKMMSAKELFALIGKKINILDDASSRKNIGLRRMFSKYLNTDASSFWQKDTNPLELKLKTKENDLKPITSEELAAHLGDNKRNYMQLGANAFTKLMLDTMKI